MEKIQRTGLVLFLLLSSCSSPEFGVKVEKEVLSSQPTGGVHPQIKWRF